MNSSLQASAHDDEWIFADDKAADAVSWNEVTIEHDETRREEERTMTSLEKR